MRTSNFEVKNVLLHLLRSSKFDVQRSTLVFSAIISSASRATFIDAPGLSSEEIIFARRSTCWVRSSGLARKSMAAAATESAWPNHGMNSGHDVLSAFV